MSNMIKIFLVIGAALITISLYVLLSNPLPQKPIAGEGGGINDNDAIGGDFNLIDQNGKAFSSDQLKGKLSLIYFGFTYCPDVCPTSLQKITEVINTTDKYRIDVTPVFITIDPQRDTSELLKEYLGHFHPKFIGLTGTPEEIKKAADKFKVYYARSSSTDPSNSNYMLDHTSFCYLMDKKGKYMKHFYLNSTAEEIIDYIRVHGK
jgi:protein SCO1/2